MLIDCRIFFKLPQAQIMVIKVFSRCRHAQTYMVLFDGGGGPSIKNFLFYHNKSVAVATSWTQDAPGAWHQCFHICAGENVKVQNAPSLMFPVAVWLPQRWRIRVRLGDARRRQTTISRFVVNRWFLRHCGVAASDRFNLSIASWGKRWFGASEGCTFKMVDFLLGLPSRLRHGGFGVDVITVHIFAQLLWCHGELKRVE